MTKHAGGNPEALANRVEQLGERVRALRTEVERHVIGQDGIIEDLLVGVLAGGHVLLEGLPGLGKTLLVKTMGRCLGLECRRIQFTPDLMPSDVTGTRIVTRAGERTEFTFQRGPLFGNLVIADEINRATPKTQSALLEAMQEGNVTVGDETHALPRPFTVVATQNPIELEGTYPLPEAQLDRFLFHLVVRAPVVHDLMRVLSSTTDAVDEQPKVLLSGDEVLEIQALAREVLIGEHLVRWVAELLAVTNPDSPTATDATKRVVRYGASPRAGQAVILAAKVHALLDARPAVRREDLERSVLPALRHRVVLGFEADAEDVGVEDLLPEWIAAADRLAKQR